MSVVLRLNLLVNLAFALILLACMAILISQSKTDVQREIDASITMTTTLLERTAVAARLEGVLFEQALTELPHPRHVRLVVQDREGWISYDSRPTPIEDTHHWFHQLVWNQDRENRERRLRVGDDEVIVIGYPWDELDEMQESVLRLLWLLLGCALVTNLAVFGGGRLSLRPINEFLRALDQIQQGHFQARLQSYSLSETRRLAEHFNRMASALEQQQQQNRQLTQQLVHLQEQERAQLARELHDDLGQHLSAIKALAYVISHAAEPDSDTKRHAEQIHDNSHTMLNSFRQIIQRLRPAILDRVTVYEACRQLGIEWSQRVGIAFDLSIDDSLPALVPEQSIHIYRILQEALNNITKHADARYVQVEFSVDRTGEVPLWKMSIEDQGNGFNCSTHSDGMGLLFMRERAQTLGANIQIDSAARVGTHIVLSLPLNVNTIKNTTHEMNYESAYH